MNSPTARKSCYERSSSQQPECHTITCTTREIRVVRLYTFTRTKKNDDTQYSFSPVTFSPYRKYREIYHSLEKEAPTCHLIDYEFNFRSLLLEKKMTRHKQDNYKSDLYEQTFQSNKDYKNPYGNKEVNQIFQSF